MDKAHSVLKRIVLGTAFVIGIVLFTACGGNGAADFPGERWTLEWSAGGGILPQSSRVWLDSDGHLTTTSGDLLTNSGPKYKTRSEKLPAAEISKLRAAMRSVDFAQLRKRKLDPMCNDCSLTSITVWSDGQGFLVHLMPNEPAASEKLFDALSALYKAYEPTR